jgi:hypothetical protein
MLVKIVLSMDRNSMEFHKHEFVNLFDIDKLYGIYIKALDTEKDGVKKLCITYIRNRDRK